MKYHFFLLAYLLVKSTCVFAQVLPNSEKFEPERIAISRSRVFRVPDSMQRRAQQILGFAKFDPAAPAIVDELFGHQIFDTKSMLEAQAAAAEEYAVQREKEAAEPFFNDSREWMLAHARAHRAYADYTRKLSSDLKPYLVKSKVYFEGTGGYLVTLCGSLLKVSHGSLGHSTPPQKTVVILVFLERDIDSVEVSASIAE